MKRRLAPALLAGAALLAAAPAARAQADSAAAADTAAPPARTCVAVPASSPLIPGAQQRREHREMRRSLREIARRHGVAAPAGLLSVRAGGGAGVRVAYLESNLPAAGSREVVRAMERYLSALERGRRFEMLVRVDGTEPVVAAGKRHCRPEPLNTHELFEAVDDVLKGRARGAVPAGRMAQRPAVQLVVNRRGQVVHVDVERPSGDAVLDARLPEVAARLRFAPATLDGAPFDTRLRYVFP